MALPESFTRDFLLNFLAQFLFSSVFAILIPAIPIYLSRFGAKESEIGFLVGIFSVSSLVLRPLVGRALLWIPERNFMLGGALIYALSCFVYLFAPPFWPLFAVRFFHGIGLAFFSTASYTLLANITPKKHIGRFTSYFYMANNLAFAFGPYFAMHLINRYSFAVLFWVCTGFSLGCLFMTTKLSGSKMVSRENPDAGIRLYLNREALPPSFLACTLNIIWGALVAFFPLFALKHGVSNSGAFFLTMALTLVLGRALGGRILDVYRRERVIIPCLMLVVMAIVTLIFSTTLPMFILVAFLLGGGWSLLYPSLMIFALEKGGSARGPAMGTFTAIADMGSSLGPMIMGLILEWTSYPVMFFSLVLIGITNIFYFRLAMERKE